MRNEHFVVLWVVGLRTSQTYAELRNERTVRACDHELGSSVLFGRRIGFSRTPLYLLPWYLGDCQYEPSSNGLVLSLLINPAGETKYAAKLNGLHLEVFLNNTILVSRPGSRPSRTTVIGALAAAGRGDGGEPHSLLRVPNVTKTCRFPRNTSCSSCSRSMAGL